jgi:hypothetical protein
MKTQASTATAANATVRPIVDTAPEYRNAIEDAWPEDEV